MVRAVVDWDEVSACSIVMSPVSVAATFCPTYEWRCRWSPAGAARFFQRYPAQVDVRRSVLELRRRLLRLDHLHVIDGGDGPHARAKRLSLPPG